MTTGIRVSSETVYYAPTARRRYLTARAAAGAEARARIKIKYPTEAGETDECGRVVDPGWHWTSDPRLVRLHERLAKRLLREFRRNHGVFS